LYYSVIDLLLQPQKQRAKERRCCNKHSKHFIWQK
jgi:hypothetical protein